MSNVLKLKEKARALELRSQWRPALEVYQRLAEEEGEEIGIWNRIGDLHLRLGEAHRAVEAYERGVDAYAEAGLLNNAIALCNKILRTAPERTVVHRKLARFTASQGFRADARAHFLKFAERMRKLGHHEEAIEALREATAHLPEDVALRRLLTEQLLERGRRTEAAEQLRSLLPQLDPRGEEAEAVRAQLHEIDPRAPETTLPPPATPAAEPPHGSLREEEWGDEPPEPGAEAAADSAYGELEIERSAALEAYELPDANSIEGFERVQHDDADLPEGAPPPLPLMDLQLESFGPEEEAQAPGGPRSELELEEEWGSGAGGGALWRGIADAGEDPPSRGGRTGAATGGAASHFERALALKEQGRLDEAIAELQAALREGSRPVPTLEALGECFHAKGQYSLAARVLERALGETQAAEEEQVGVHYWLARSQEALGETGRAREHYERVLAFDILHRDAQARMAVLADEGDAPAR